MHCKGNNWDTRLSSKSYPRNQSHLIANKNFMPKIIFLFLEIWLDSSLTVLSVECCGIIIGIW